jgi:UDPglucose 6-dehydrogenase
MVEHHARTPISFPRQDLIKPADIGFVGFGIVGRATAFAFAEKSRGRDRICFYDKFQETPPLETVIQASEFVFICLPTPMKEDESGIDLSIVEENIHNISRVTDGTDKVVILKSTIIPGTTNRFEAQYPNTRFAFNPEFLTEANSVQDVLNAPEVVLGANNDSTYRRLATFYQERFPSIHVWPNPGTKAAEVVKYFRNAFLATKVTFGNQMKDFCETIDVNYHEVKTIAAADPRIVDAHLDVSSLRGFGGKCFPKDVVALRGAFIEAGVDHSLLDSIWDYNKRIRQQHDWVEIPGTVSGNDKLYKEVS